MAIAEPLLEQILEIARENEAKRVEEVLIEVGLMRQVVPEALEMAFLELSRGTAAENAKLIQVEVPIKARCHKCDAEFGAGPESFQCPKCGQADVEIIAGGDIILKSLTCEQEDVN